MKNLFILSSLFCSLIPAAQADEPTIKHRTCNLVITGAGEEFNESLKQKGYSEATYQWRYLENGKVEKVIAWPVSDNDLIDRFDQNKLDQGATELRAKLNAIHYSGRPTLRLYNSEGKLIPMKEKSLNSHMGEFLFGYEVNIGNTDKIQVARVLELNKAKVAKTDANWHKLEYQPIYEKELERTGMFTLASAAEKFLTKHESGLMDEEKIALSIIAGRKVSEKDRSKLSEFELQFAKMVLIENQEFDARSNDKLLEEAKAAMPRCEMKRDSANESQRDAVVSQPAR